MDLLHQRARGARHRCPQPDAAPREPRACARAALRRGGGGDDHRRAGGARLRRRRGAGGGLGERPDARPPGAGGRLDCRVRGDRSALGGPACSAADVPLARSGRRQPGAARARHARLRHAVHPHPVRPAGARLVARRVRGRLGRDAGHGGDRISHGPGARHQGRPAPRSRGQHGADRAGLPAADTGVRRRQLPGRRLLRSARLRPRTGRRLRGRLDRIARRRARGGGGPGLGTQQHLVPDRRRNRRRDPVERGGFRGAGRGPACRAHERLPGRLRDGDRVRRAGAARGDRAAREAGRARAGPRD